MARTKPYTAGELFDEIIKQVGTPEWVEYALACNHIYDRGSGADSYGRVFLQYDEFDIYTTTQYGGSEGVYTDVFIQGNYKGPDEDYDSKPIKIGTIKTLREGPEAVKKMYAFAADVYILATDYVNKNHDDFIWKGYKITPDPNESIAFYYGSEESMARRIDKMVADGKDLSQAIITDMATRKTVDPAKYIPVDKEPDDGPDI